MGLNRARRSRIRGGGSQPLGAWRWTHSNAAIVDAEAWYGTWSKHSRPQLATSSSRCTATTRAGALPASSASAVQANLHPSDAELTASQPVAVSSAPARRPRFAPGSSSTKYPARHQVRASTTPKGHYIHLTQDAGRQIVNRSPTQYGR